MLPANPPGGEYAKGKGVEFEDWRAKNKGEALFLRLERAEGGRQDLAFDGALPLFVNRMVLLEFLRDVVFVPGHANILEDALWILLRSNEVTAALRVFTLFDLLLSRQMRYISGKSDALKDWSIYSMSDVLDGVEAILILIAEDGQVLLLRPTPRAWSAGLRCLTEPITCRKSSIRPWTSSRTSPRSSLSSRHGARTSLTRP